MRRALVCFTFGPLLLTALLLAGCRSHPATQTVVIFHAQAGLRAEATRIRVQVTANDGTSVYDEENVIVTSGAGTLATVPLIPVGGDASRTFEVYAELLGESGSLAELRIVSGYVSRELREVHAWFDDECRGITCGEGRSCDRGVCLGACYDAQPSGTTERSEPTCGECGECVGGSCAPRPDGETCGCAGTDRCVAGVCDTAAPVADVQGGQLHTCAAVRSGGLYCWGSNRVGQLGTGGSATSLPEPVALGSIAEGTAGTDHTCWLQFTGERYCWGWNGNGQLGNGTVMDGRTEPPEAAPDADPQWSQIDAGWYSMCGLASDGRVFCWGTNMAGEVGVEPPEDGELVPTPNLVSEDMRFSSVTMGGFHACAIRDDGALYCWGLNASGELGTGGTEDTSTPTQSGCTEGECFDDWVAVAAGDFHTCAIREGGQLYCWGGGLNGQLGIGVIPERDVTRAQEVEGRYRAVAGGQSHTCAIAQDGRLWCWGQNDLGQLGLGDLERRDAPAEVTVPGADGFLRLGIGRSHSCVVLADESLWCFGWNEDGQLGLGFETAAGELPISTPRRVCFPE